MLTELRDVALRHAEALEEVNLSDNWLTVIHPRAFTHLPRLVALDLSHNMLEVMRPQVLQPIERSLRSLSLQGEWYRPFSSNLPLPCHSIPLTSLPLKPFQSHLPINSPSSPHTHSPSQLSLVGPTTGGEKCYNDPVLRRRTGDT